jgi:uncharacterized protein
MDTGSPSPQITSAKPRRRLRRALKVVALLVPVVAVATYAGVSFMVYDGLSKATGACWPADRANTPDNFKVPAQYNQALATANLMPVPQDITFHSRDPQIPNVKLAGWWIPADNASAPAVILVHGVQSCRREASVLVPAGMLHRNGFSVFLIDIRDHGDSQGEDGRFAAGADEYMDVLGAWDWVRTQGVPAAKIGLAGMSFGSANVLIAGGQEPQVAAAWTDSAYTYTERAIGLFLKDQTGLPDILVPGAILWARIIANDNLTAFNPIDELNHYAGRSVAFVHGADDKVLPASMAGELYDRAVASGAKATAPWVVPGAGHTQAVFVAPAEYETRLVTFFTTALGAP